MISAIVIGVITLYLILIIMLSYGFDKTEEFSLSDVTPKTKFSVIIPFRNEEEHLTQLLESLKSLNYPNSHFEVIFVDDDSNDNSVRQIRDGLKVSGKQRLDSQVVSNNRFSKSPKKDAITTAVALAKYDWIVTTDADCVLPTYWLDALDEFIQSKTVHCIFGPVTYNHLHSFFNRFQALDFLSLQGSTMGGFGLKRPFLCNGANMAFLKSKFESLGGFDGNNHIASGDDLFMLDKFLASDRSSIGYLKSDKCIVTTAPQSTVSHLIQQRIRWASKTSKTSNNFTKLVGFLVFLTNFTCVLLIPFTILGILNLRTALLLFILKFCIDFLLLFKTCRFFKQEQLLISYVFSSCIYPFFTVYIAVSSLFMSFSWKGRKFKS